MLSDASAAIGIVQRSGLGKVRHLAIAGLWVQQRVRRGELLVGKIPGERNPADLMTKSLDRKRMEALQDIMGVKQGGEEENSNAA